MGLGQGLGIGIGKAPWGNSFPPRGEIGKVDPPISHALIPPCRMRRFTLPCPSSNVCSIRPS